METAEENSKLLIVDDDMKYCRLIKEYLSGFGYDVTTVHNGREGLEAALQQQCSSEGGGLPWRVFL